MASHVLVVATVTAASDDLLAALQERARRGPVDFMLVMPATGPGLAGRRDTEPRLQEALERWRAAGLRAEGVAGNSDPLDAVSEICRPGRFDEVIVSTLPGRSSRWLRSDLPYRIGALTDLPVTHVTAMSMVRPAPHAGPLPEKEKHSPLGLLNVMAYRGARGPSTKP
jgi:GABA permease